MKRAFFIACIVLIALGFKFISTEPSHKLIPTHFENESLFEQIQSYAKKHNKEPTDAVIDRVWKLVPGYNGLEINIEESYLNMSPTGKFDKDLLIFNESSPDVHFSELPPTPIYKGNPEKPMVTFLINVAWGNEFIPPILETLKKHNVHATFFFDGSWVKSNPDLARKIDQAKHEIGNHAYSHPNLAAYNRSQTMDELVKTNEIIEKTIHRKVKWFAPPSGSFTDETVKIAHELDMYTILWTVDTVDWRKPNTSEMVNRVVSKVHPGAMILMHPTKPTAEGLDQMIQEIKKKGYELGTVSNMMDEKRM